MKLGKVLGKLFGGLVAETERAEDRWLRGLLLTAVGAIEPKVGQEVVIGSHPVRLLKSRYSVRLLATREE